MNIPPAVVKIFKPKTWFGRLMLRGLIMNAVLFGTITVFYCEERWRGEHAWNRYKAEAKARGTKLTIAEFIRPPIKDEDNFAAIPLFRDVFDTNSTTIHFEIPYAHSTNKTAVLGSTTDFGVWRDKFVTEGFFTNTTDSAAYDVLEALKKFDSEFVQLRAAAARPDCQFPVKWKNGFNVQMPHLNLIMQAARVLRLRIAAELAEGKSAEAYEDSKICLRLYHALEKDIGLLPGLVRVAILAQVESAVREGIFTGRWKPAEIVAIEKDLAALNVVADCEFTLQGERTFSNDEIERLRAGALVGLFQTFSFAGIFRDYSREKIVMALFPHGWLRQNEVAINRFCDAWASRLDTKNSRFLATPTTAQINRDLGCDGMIGQFAYLPANLLLPALDKAQNKFVCCAAQTEQAKTACALERHRIARETYPEKLDDLVPEFLPKVPSDPVDGKPLRYEKHPAGGYVLWSPDLEHKIAALAGTNPPPVGDWETEVWVWRVPAR